MTYKKFLNKSWRQTLDDFEQKLSTTGLIERSARSSCPRSPRTADNVATIQDTDNVNL